MTVSALNWKFIGSSTMASSTTIDAILDGIYTLLNSSTYHDGSSRTAGSGIAWSPSKVQDSSTTIAVHCEPSSAASSTCRGMRVIFAGIDTSSSANFPLYNLNGTTGPAQEESNSGGDTGQKHQWLQACLFGGLAKNAGSFNSITAGADTTPFTSGGFTGFTRISQESHFNNSVLYMYESLDAIYFVIMQGSHATGETNHFAAGGILDPGSDHAVDSEADEVVYGLLCSANKNSSFTFDIGASNTEYPNFRASDNQAVALSFSVGATTYTVQPLYFNNFSRRDAGGSGGEESTALRSGRRFLQPLVANEFYDTGGERHIVGRLREIFFADHVKSGTKLTGGGNDLGYFVSPRVNADDYTGLILKA